MPAVRRMPILTIILEGAGAVISVYLVCTWSTSCL